MSDGEIWRPMLSAPKDGSTILFWFKHRPAIGYWESQLNCWLFDSMNVHEGDKPGGWAPLPTWPRGALA